MIDNWLLSQDGKKYYRTSKFHNSVFVFIGFPRSVDKTKIYNFKNKKTYFAIWIFHAMLGYEFHFFMTTLKFFKINMGKLFPVPFKNDSRQEFLLQHILQHLSVCSKWIYTEVYQRAGTASYPDLKFWSLGASGPPAGAS